MIKIEELDEAIEEVVQESLELYPDYCCSFINIWPITGIVEASGGPRHDAPISIPFTEFLIENEEERTVIINYRLLHSLIK